ncbi:MAG: hypothetical protein KIT72_11095 [Polyangiaceae bacterium]|nr:hypothetical protein [Polyangiaceae bacterium]MCW5790957.1 hypothetical protein [Polyangiaceae bacterium]
MRRLTALLTLLALTGCGKSPAPAEPSSAASSSQATASGGAPAAPSTEPLGAAPVLEPGCYDDAPLGEEPTEALGTLGRACAPGMTPILPAPSQITLEAGRGQLKLTLTSLDRCFRAAVVAPGARAVSIAAQSPSGAELTTARLGAPFALLDTEGPVCPAETGDHPLTIQTEPSVTTAWVQAWLAE